MTLINIVDASIQEIEGALSSGAVTTVDLVAKHLKRIAMYDCHGPELNSVPILNMNVLTDAAASDERRRTGCTPTGLLEGIPYTVKDSYKVSGMTVASGSPAFAELVATDDAFTVAAIRAAGGILIGRTNMPPMAYGGMQRGVYGRAESPYAPNKFLAAAWSSGSSNGSAASTAASMAVFGMAEETVSSGRSPASNNGLVAYTPSRGVISIRGNWPLYPTCDVIVPHTRSIADLARLLDVIAANDPVTVGDFWRDQPFVKLPKPWEGRVLGGPHASFGPGTFDKVLSATTLAGLRIAVPGMYIGGPMPEQATPVTVSGDVKLLWERARHDLESLGAEIIVVPDFPAVTAYEHPGCLSPPNAPRLPDDSEVHEKNHVLAHGWDSFLRSCNDPKFKEGLISVDEFEIFPERMRTEVELKFQPKTNAIPWGSLAKAVYDSGGPGTMYGSDYLRDSLQVLENMRKALLDDYLEKVGCDLFAWPCQGDVAPADADINLESASMAWKNGVHYSHGNKALRHLGIPSVTVPMGLLPTKHMPMGLTFAGRAYDDGMLLQCAHAYENMTHHRVAPLEHCPRLPSDGVDLADNCLPQRRERRPALTVEKCFKSGQGDTCDITIAGTVVIQSGDTKRVLVPSVEITVSGTDIPIDDIDVHPSQDGTASSFQFSATVSIPAPVERNGREKTLVPVARDKTMVVILARASPSGFPDGRLFLV